MADYTPSWRRTEESNPNAFAPPLSKRVQHHAGLSSKSLSRGLEPHDAITALHLPLADPGPAWFTLTQRKMEESDPNALASPVFEAGCPPLDIHLPNQQRKMGESNANAEASPGFKAGGAPLHLHLPCFRPFGGTLQTVILTQIAKAAATGDIQALDHLLDLTWRLSGDVLLNHQLSHLALVLGHAQKQVPFYKERLEPFLNKPLSLGTFQEIPILTRNEVQEAGASIQCENVSPAMKSVGQIATSGSTGRPLMTDRTLAITTLFDALRKRFHGWFKRDYDVTAAFITAVHDKGVAEPPDGLRTPSWSHGLGTGEGAVLTLGAPVKAQLDWLLKQEPVYLATYPSNLLGLLKLSETRGITISTLKNVTLASESVTDELIEMCHRVWDVKISLTYSANEVGAIALGHPDYEGYLVQSESLVVEVVDQDEKACSEGEVGRVVVTTLQDGLRPLIRYAIGDYAEVGKPTERGRPTLRRIMGRERNLLSLPNGHQAWPLFDIKSMLDIEPLRQWQMIQTSLNTIKVNVVSTEPLTKDQEACLRQCVLKYLPAPFNVEIQRVDEVQRKKGQKYEDFINQIGS